MNLDLHLTTACNMKCSFCGAWEYGKEHAYITLADAEKALDAGRKSGYRITTLTGGEPAIHPEYCRILKAAHRKGYWTVVTTNCLHLYEEIIKAYKRCRTLAEGDSITAKKLLDIFGTDQESAEKVAELLEELTEQAYISNGAEDRVKELITHLIVGTASMGFGGNAGGYSSTLLVCDSNIVTEQLEIMSGQISLPMEVLSEEDTAEIAAADLTGILFALEQALFTSSGRQCLSMVLASLGISFVACVSTAYTGSFLPCLLAHECFLVFYFGRFRYY